MTNWSREEIHFLSGNVLAFKYWKNAIIKGKTSKSPAVKEVNINCKKVMVSMESMYDLVCQKIISAELNSIHSHGLNTYMQFLLIVILKIFLFNRIQKWKTLLNYISNTFTGSVCFLWKQTP